MFDASVAVAPPVTTPFRARSVTLDYLRTCIVVLVLLHHSNEAYAMFGHFDMPHYLSSSAPILDTHRWIVSDLLWQFDEPFFMSLMFPAIFALGVQGLGPNTKIGGSLIIMAIIGGAVWTPIMGLISDKTGSMAIAMIIPLIGYLYVMYYSFVGSKPSGPVYEGTEYKVVAAH